MTQQRRFHRVLLTARSSLIHREVSHEGRLENVSLNGALTSFSDGVPVNTGDRCALMIYADDEETPLRLAAEVVHTCFTMVGTQFVSVDDDTRQRLYRIIERVSGEPLKLKAEMETIRARMADYLRSA